MMFPIPMGVFFHGEIYCALATYSPAEINCPSTVVLFCSVYESESHRMAYNPFVVVSSELMAPYIPD